MLSFVCKQSDLFDSTNSPENLSTYDHCVRLPIHIHQLLPEEQAKIYLGLYPSESEVMYIRKERIDGTMVKLLYYRKCSQNGWEFPKVFMRGFQKKGEEYYNTCQRSLGRKKETGFGSSGAGFSDI